MDESMASGCEEAAIEKDLNKQHQSMSDPATALSHPSPFSLNNRCDQSALVRAVVIIIIVLCKKTSKRKVRMRIVSSSSAR